MREHQIVITLKPDQFAEVQKLSKAAGAKSMGIFVRKALLASLGIEGTPPQPSASMPVSSEETVKIAEGLRRLQKELKILVSDTLSQAETIVADQVVAVSSSLAELQAQTGISTKPEAVRPAVISPPPLADDYIDDEEEPADLTEEDEEPSLVRDPLEDLLDRSLMERLKEYKDSVDRTKQKSSKGASASKEGKSEGDEPELPDSEFEADEWKSAIADDEDSGPQTAFDQKSPPFSGGPPPKRRP